MALLKSTLFTGNSILVLGGGLGVDDWAFSKSFRQVVSVDPDESLNEIARYNFDRLHCTNVERLTTTAEDFLKTRSGTFDLIYSDPDRRTGNSRQILLRQHQPDMVALLPALHTLSQRVLIKCSPLYDHEMAKNEISSITDIYIISSKGEVKEMLLLARHGEEGQDYRIHCFEIDRENHHLSHTFSSQNIQTPETAAELTGYFFEVNAGIYKVRKHNEYAAEKGLRMVDRNVPFYCSDNIPGDFMGRTMLIRQVMPFHVKENRRYLQETGIAKANVKVRGLKFRTEDVLHKLEIGEGGEDYLFVFPFKGKATLLHAIRN